MPPILSKPSSAAPTALFFITVGALLTVWSLIWFMYLHNHEDSKEIFRYLDYGLLATGIVMLIIGFGTGRIGRSARQAELPPEEAASTIAANNAAAQPHRSPVQNT